MRIRPAAILLAVAITANACSGAENTTAANADKVTYLTSFNTFGRDAYAYVAQEKGYFTEARLDVTINLGAATVEVLKLVASGRADFGVGDFTATVITVAKEKLPVTTVAMVHQKSLSAIVTLADRRISTPADLVGKRIGDQPGSTNQVMFPVYAKAAGIDPGKVEFVPAAPPALPRLLVSGQVDGIGPVGLKVAISLAVIGAVIAEFVGAKAGLGYVIVQSGASIDTALAFVAMTLLAIMSITLFYGLVLLPWSQD